MQPNQGATLPTDPLDRALNERNDAEEQARKTAQKLRYAREDLRWLMQDRRGRRFVHGLLEQTGIFRTSFNTNALQMAFNEGQRNMGLKMQHDLLTWAPDNYAKMLEEANSDD